MDLIALARMRTQGISHPFAGLTPRDVVSLLLAVQSQDYLGGKWSVALRLKGVTDADLDRELDEGRILRTHILRPTWHFVLPEDIRWLLAVTSPRVIALNASTARRFELDARTTARGLDIIQRALEGGKWRTRDELGALLERGRVKSAKGVRLGYLVMQAELEGLIASGPRRGKQFTYGLLGERAPVRGKGRAKDALPAKPATRDEALARLAMRYFTGHGPATVRDLARWATQTLAEAQRAAEAAGDSLRREKRGGESDLWMAADAPATEAHGKHDHLLCVYDEYVNGYRDRSAMFDPRHATVITGRGAAVTQVYTLGGQVLGTWSRVIGKERVQVTLDPFDARVTRRLLESRLAPSAAAYGRFLGLDAVVRTA